MRLISIQKSSIGENWPVGGRMSSGSTTGSSGSDVSMKYIVYKQPLSLDRFFIHEVRLGLFYLPELFSFIYNIFTSMTFKFIYCFIEL